MIVHKHIKQTGILLFLVLGAFLFQTVPSAYSYPVPPLPEDNLMTNPWFRSVSNPAEPGFDGWTPVLIDGVGWGLSQKESNPSPDLVISGRCGFKQVYCGTGARWANERNEGDTLSYPGLDVYLYQIVNAEAANRKLNYSMYWVNHKIDVAEVKVYGSDSANGAWTEVWQPFSVSQDKNPPPGSSPGREGIPWFHTGMLETILGKGYAYYKIEIHARYPESDTQQGDVGIKITGVYFAAGFTSEPEKLSTPVIVQNPTISSPNTGEDESKPTTGPSSEQGTPQETPQRVRTPSPTPTPTMQPSLPQPTRTRQASSTPLPVVSPTVQDDLKPTSDAVEQGGIGLGFVIGLITAGLILFAIVVIRTAVKKT